MNRLPRPLVNALALVGLTALACVAWVYLNMWLWPEGL